MANQFTWDSLTDDQKEQLRRVFGEPEKDEAIPNGLIRLTKTITEYVSVEEALSRTERLKLDEEDIESTEEEDATIQANGQG